VGDRGETRVVASDGGAARAAPSCGVLGMQKLGGNERPWWGEGLSKGTPLGNRDIKKDNQGGHGKRNYRTGLKRRSFADDY